MIADRRPLPDDLDALKEIIGGRPADDAEIGHV